jgi:hypothetical protein
MGIYLNSGKDTDSSKRVILERLTSKEPVNREAVLTAPPHGWAYICLVESGFFNALGVLYSKREAQEFADMRGRPATFYKVKIDEIAPFLASTRDLEDIRYGQDAKSAAA